MKKISVKFRYSLDKVDFENFIANVFGRIKHNVLIFIKYLRFFKGAVQYLI